MRGLRILFTFMQQNRWYIFRFAIRLQEQKKVGLFSLDTDRISGQDGLKPESIGIQDVLKALSFYISNFMGYTE